MHASESRPEPYSQPPGAPPSWPQAPPRPESDPRRKSPVLACLLSLMPGLGQIYVGYYRLGFVNVLIFGSAIAFASNNVLRGMEPLFALFIPFFLLYNIIDAGRRAAFYNEALDGLPGVEIPREMDLPGPGGSLAGGAALIVIGLILLSNTLFDISLEWLEDWWPVAPVAVGVWLILRGVQERKSTP